MTTGEVHQTDSTTAGTEVREQYLKHGVKAEDEYHASRSADRQAAFFVPHLRPGMRLLDCGCGPGSITLGLAARVAPGEVVGIDIDESALDKAKVAAREANVDNVRFETGSVYNLPVADESIDAVFSHALFEHLGDPLVALSEFLRVLKPGGVVGIRTPDWDGVLMTPMDSTLETWLRRALDRFVRSGGDMCRGKHLRRFLRESGYAHNEITVTYEVRATPEARRKWVGRRTNKESLSRGLAQDVFDEETMNEIIAAWNRWAEDPDAFLAVPWVEIAGWKAV